MRSELRASVLGLVACVGCGTDSNTAQGTETRMTSGGTNSGRTASSAGNASATSGRSGTGGGTPRTGATAGIENEPSTGGATSAGGPNSAGGAGGANSAGGAGGANSAGGAGGPNSAGGAGDRTWVWGITLDDIWGNRDAIVDSIRSLGQPITARIVFDEGMAAADYDQPVREIAAVARIQGELVDSLYVPDYSVTEYIARANEYLDLLGDVVDIWEVGNEVNGEWVGDASDVSAKILGAYRAVKAHGGRTALTLYYNGTYDGGAATVNNCWQVAANQMQIWAAANVAPEMKTGLDYVWISYYEDDCNGIQPDWSGIFGDLAAMFQNSSLGIGECGTETGSSKASFIHRYYRDLKLPEPRFVGGFFWWYARQDFVPKTNPLWQTLEDAMNARP